MFVGFNVCFQATELTDLSVGAAVSTTTLDFGTYFSGTTTHISVMELSINLTIHIMSKFT